MTLARLFEGGYLKPDALARLEAARDRMSGSQVEVHASLRKARNLAWISVLRPPNPALSRSARFPGNLPQLAALERGYQPDIQESAQATGCGIVVTSLVASVFLIVSARFLRKDRPLVG
jgi:hypothetical protein